MLGEHVHQVESVSRPPRDVGKRRRTQTSLRRFIHDGLVNLNGRQAASERVALVNQENTNTFAGSNTLAGNTRVGVFGVFGKLNLNGPINGPGGLEKTGPSPLSLGRLDAN